MRQFFTLLQFFKFFSTLLKMSLFEASNGWEEGGGGGGRGWAERLPFHKIRHTYPTMMKLGTVIPYLNKIQKICKSLDKPLEFC